METKNLINKRGDNTGYGRVTHGCYIGLTTQEKSKKQRDLEPVLEMIYIIHFKNGYRYIGSTNKITSRMTMHYQTAKNKNTLNYECNKEMYNNFDVDWVQQLLRPGYSKSCLKEEERKLIMSSSRLYNKMNNGNNGKDPKVEELEEW